MTYIERSDNKMYERKEGVEMLGTAITEFVKKHFNYWKHLKSELTEIQRRKLTWQIYINNLVPSYV